MKIFHALSESFKKKDNTASERFEYNRVRSTIEEMCDSKLKNADDVLEFEALPSAIDATLMTLDSREFLDKYEFTQVSETVFAVRLRELDLM